MKKFFKKTAFESDAIITKFIKYELYRQNNSIELIASENITSKSLLEAQGSVLTNKYAEGYPHKRYYSGCNFVDKIEKLAIARVKKLYYCNFANVQSHSGSQANQSVFFSLLNNNDKIMSLSLDCGGHLTHGSLVNLSGKLFSVKHYLVDKKCFNINFYRVQKLALKIKPKLIIAGGSAYSRKINFFKFRQISDLVGAYLLVDMAHISGIVAAEYHQNPIKYSHIITSTTHKTLRGPRGGIVLTNYKNIFNKINYGVFPGIQGGPLMHVIAAKAIAFKEALKPKFNNYIKLVLINAKILARILKNRSYNIISNGTDIHLMLIDLRKFKITGKLADESLYNSGLTCNKNTIPFDDCKPFVTSGVRFGTASATTRGFKEFEFVITANLVSDVFDNLIHCKQLNILTQNTVLRTSLYLCKKFSIY